MKLSIQAWRHENENVFCESDRGVGLRRPVVRRQPRSGKVELLFGRGNGAKLSWTLAVAEEAGQLAAVANLDGADMELIEPKVEGNKLTFKLRVNDHEVVWFELYIDGDTLSGRFEGTDSGKATITGTRAAT